MTNLSTRTTWGANPEGTDGACVEVRMKGTTKKVNKGTVADLGTFVSGLVNESKYKNASVYFDGSEVLPGDIGDYDIDDVDMIEIKPYDAFAV